MFFFLLLPEFDFCRRFDEAEATGNLSNFAISPSEKLENGMQASFIVIIIIIIMELPRVVINFFFFLSVLVANVIYLRFSLAVLQHPLVF